MKRNRIKNRRELRRELISDGFTFSPKRKFKDRIYIDFDACIAEAELNATQNGEKSGEFTLSVPWALGRNNKGYTVYFWINLNFKTQNMSMAVKIYNKLMQANWNGTDSQAREILAETVAGGALIRAYYANRREIIKLMHLNVLENI